MSETTEHASLPEAFAALGVRPSILRALGELKYTKPTEIQAMLIPRALAGVDLLGQARTGTGKTAAFGIPILQKCQRQIPTQAIILVPTRELAVQVQSEIQRYAQYTPLRSLAVYGGQKITAQLKFLRHHPEILVGTPGRVIDLLDRRIINFENVRFVVLDEVDRMLDIGFRDDIRNILSRIKGMRGSGQDSSGERSDRGRSGSPGGEGGQEGQDAPGERPIDELRAGRYHQTMFVSATISEEIEKLGRRFMREPIEMLVAPGSDDKPTVAEVEQFYLSVQPWDKYRLLRQLVMQENPDLAIVFCRTKHTANKIAHKLDADGILCHEIHGDLEQSKRERVMKAFRSGKFDVLVATDLASRGIDVADISHIINYDIPEDPEVYVHRVGRTARMGAAGRAFTLVTPEQGDLLTQVESLINMVIPQAQVEGYVGTSPPVDRFAGPSSQEAPRAPIVSRFERPYGGAAPASANTGAPGSTPPAGQTMTIPPRTLGSKIPINRRHRRRR